MAESRWYVGRLFWINGELYRVTRVGEKGPNSNLVPLDVEIVTIENV